RRRGHEPDLRRLPARELGFRTVTFALPPRRGPRPATTATNPHTQLDQRPPARVISELADALFALPGVRERPSAISVPGARALWLVERSEEHTSELQSQSNLVCRLLLEKKKKNKNK